MITDTSKILYWLFYIKELPSQIPDDGGIKFFLNLKTI